MDKKESENKALLYGIIGFIIGVVVTLFVARSAVNNNNMGMMNMMGMRQSQQMMESRQDEMMGHGMGMDDMVNELSDKSGDEFDKSFIDLMIEHHQGAIDMANLAKQNAKHQEIKDLAGDIIKAQTDEIGMMQQWQKTWGY